MFDRLTDTFNGLYRSLTGQDTITEKNVADAMANVRTALLDADVHLEVVNKFCDDVLKEAAGREVTRSLKPGEEMIGIVYRKLVDLLGGDSRPAAQMPDLPGPLAAAGALPPASPILSFSPGPTIVMMCGLQGSGKTTTCGKLAGYLKKRGRSVMLVACDLQRPAAVEQLETVAGVAQNELQGGAAVSFFGEKDKVAEYGKAVGVAVQVARRAVDEARRTGVDVVILDTAGRLHINDELMGELTQVKTSVQPHHIFLVVDAMTGQDAVNSARVFNSRLAIDGVILTKFDSDARGGAALSVRNVTGAPIKFVGTGEKLDAIEEFYPDRVAGRILGMGDVVSLVEKAQEEVSQEEAEALQEKMARGEMGMDDFLKQLKTLRRMGPIKQLLGMLPGVGGMLKGLNIEDKQLDRIEAMICSMTKKERAAPTLIDHSRRKRIAQGAGVKPDDIGQLVKQFDLVTRMTRQMAGLSAKDRVKAVKDMGDPTGMGGLRMKGSSASTSVKDKFKKRKR